MFDQHDPRADALKAVHEGRVTVPAYDPSGRPHFYLDDDLVWKGHMAHLHADGFIQVAEGGAVQLTVTGESMLIIACGIMPAPGPSDDEDRDYEAEDGDYEAEYVDYEDDDEDEDNPDDPDFTPRAPHRGAQDSDLPLISYAGLAPFHTGFVNGAPFRDAVRRHGLELRVESEPADRMAPLGLDELVTEEAYLDVLDPASGEAMQVLYDDECMVRMTTPGFIEILKLMDSFSIEETSERLFFDEDGFTVDPDSELWHAEFDYTTGEYREP